MGCSNGKTIKISPAEVTAVETDSGKIFKEAAGQGSQTSLKSGERPFGSATSKGSKHSHDSGYSAQEEVAEDYDNNDYANIITEDSDCKLVQEIESNFKEKELDFCLTGMPAPRNLSAKDKARLDEQRILEDLRNEGLIATSKFEARSGMAFEVVEASQQLQLRRALPARLAKLNKKKKREKTKEEIAAKLEKAERRRKEKEMEKLEKINAVTAKCDTTHIQEEQNKQQQERLENSLRKEDEVAEKKKQRIQELKDKLKAKEEHAAKVRLRRKLHIPTQEELEAIEEQERQLAAGQFQLAPVTTTAISENSATSI